MIIAANIISSSPQSQVWVTTRDGNQRFLFMYDRDQMQFQSSDFVGLSIDAALHLKFIHLQFPRP